MNCAPSSPPSLFSRDVLLLSTFQRTSAPLTEFTPSTEREKDRLLEHFSGFARSLCLLLSGRGWFADYVDPCTGHPALHGGRVVGVQ